MRRRKRRARRIKRKDGEKVMKRESVVVVVSKFKVVGGRGKEWMGRRKSTEFEKERERERRRRGEVRKQI
jgi:hypothetical protein